MFTSPLDRANLFNKTFSSKFSDPDVSALPDVPAFHIPNLTSFHIPNGKIEALLASIGKHEVCGPDGFSACILSERSCELAIPLKILSALHLTRCFPGCVKGGQHYSRS